MSNTTNVCKKCGGELKYYEFADTDLFVLPGDDDPNDEMYCPKCAEVTDATDIEALVAAARNHEKSLLHLAGGEKSYHYYAAERIHELADALERQQAVVEAAREAEAHLSDAIRLLADNELRGLCRVLGDNLKKALAALDAPPEGDG